MQCIGTVLILTSMYIKFIILIYRLQNIYYLYEHINMWHIASMWNLLLCLLSIHIIAYYVKLCGHSTKRIE